MNDEVNQKIDAIKEAIKSDAEAVRALCDIAEWQGPNLRQDTLENKEEYDKLRDIVSAAAASADVGVVFLSESNDRPEWSMRGDYLIVPFASLQDINPCGTPKSVSNSGKSASLSKQ